MKNLVKPASLLLYVFSLYLFFVIGASYAAYSGKTEGQGLAGGAVIIFYGLVLAMIAFITAILTAWKASTNFVIRINKLLFVFILFFTFSVFYRYCDSQKSEKTGASVEGVQFKSVLFTVAQNEGIQNQMPQENKENSMGLGFFKPDFITHSTIYFYGSLDDSSVGDFVPADSLVFIKKSTGAIDISYAPPWFYPEHQKVDYELLFMKLISVNRDYAEVEVNKQTRQTAFVSRAGGTTLFWPDFLLNINSVEFIEKDQEVRVRPLSYAGLVNQSSEFMRPVLIRGNWMKVDLLDENLKTVGSGWIEWEKDNQLLISYSLLS